MFCDICGKELKFSANYCPNCGISFIDVSPVESIDKKELTILEIKKRTKKMRSIIPAIVIIVIMIVLIIMEPILALFFVLPIIYYIFKIFNKQYDKKFGLYLSVGICEKSEYDAEGSSSLDFVYNTRNGNRVRDRIISDKLYCNIEEGDMIIALVSYAPSNKLLWAYSTKKYYTNLPFKKDLSEDIRLFNKK